MAERSSFSRSFAEDFFVKRRICSASSTFLPRTRSATRRTFCGDAFRYFRVALASIVVSALCLRRGCRCRSAGRPGGLLDLLAAVTFEHAGQREFAELVTDHVLGDVDRDELLPVVYGQGVADHLRNDRGAARPGLDDLLLALAIHRFDFLLEVLVDERALLE